MPENESLPSYYPAHSVDLLLVHAPAFFDFRGREDIYFPYLSTSGDVPITPLYEYFPIGFKTLQRHLQDRGFSVAILNLSTVLMKYPAVDVRALLSSVDARLIGIDLHWMVHVQGSLATAEMIKQIHPETPIVFGGISSTYYADELAAYPFIDMVMKGYDTHGPMTTLMTELKGARRFESVENLTWKRDGAVVDNGLSHTPDSFSCGIDWSTVPKEKGAQILELLSTQNAGCAYNCGWCGGSREAFRRVFKRQRAMARKPLGEVEWEFAQARSLPNVDKYFFYSVGSYNEPRDRMNHFLDQVAQTNLRGISYEQFHLTPDDTLRKMVAANKKTFITLSPESHDLRVATLAGRGVYTPAEMEDWIDRALDIGVSGIDIWYFIGMPEQDEASVHATVEYCEHLLRRFKGRRVTPLLCPMIPFLDPASTFFEYPEKHGYRVFYRTVEEHRQGMQRASIVNRTNYETQWLSRYDLVRVGYRAVQDLTRLKGEYRFLPPSVVARVSAKIDDALEFGDAVLEADNITDPVARASALRSLGSEIARRNHETFFSGVANQSYPINRDIGGRWFDETLHSSDTFERLTHHEGEAAPA
jgi:clorobiocin/coumermycin A biosynthesis protein CloN6/CouN6